MNTDATATRWDEEYRRGRYADDPPIPFVELLRLLSDALPGLLKQDSMSGAATVATFSRLSMRASNFTAWMSRRRP